MIVVEHNIEQIAPLSDLMVLMYDGNIAKAAPPGEFFENSEFLSNMGSSPQATAFIDQLKGTGLSWCAAGNAGGCGYISEHFLGSNGNGRDR